MNNIIWNSIWSNEDWINKNYSYFIKELLKKIWINKINNDILIKNHKIIDLLSVTDFEINNNIEQNLCNLWLTYIWDFDNEDSQLIDFLEYNKKEIKSWNILFWFVYDWLKIVHIIFVSNYFDANTVNDAIEYNKKEIHKSLYDLNINI